MKIVPQRHHPNDIVTQIIFVRKKMRVAVILFILDIALFLGMNIVKFYGDHIIDFENTILSITLIIIGFISFLASIGFRLFERPQKVELKFPKVT